MIFNLETDKIVLCYIYEQYSFGIYLVKLCSSFVLYTWNIIWYIIQNSSFIFVILLQAVDTREAECGQDGENHIADSTNRVSDLAYGH